MTVSIMQPTYLPWPGYFNLIARSDRFVFLDNVQFQKRSWQTRNRIPVNNAETFISVPTTGGSHQNLNEVRVDDTARWRSKHVNMLTRAYSRHPYGKEMLSMVLPTIENTALQRLVEINCTIIKELSLRLGLETEFHFSSDIQTTGTKSSRLIELCKHFGDSHYLSPEGSRGYIEEEGLFDEAAIQVEFQNYSSKPYEQQKVEGFIPYLSTIDLIANTGLDFARDYIQQ